MEAHHSKWAARPNIQINLVVHDPINDIFVIDIEPCRIEKEKFSNL